MGEGETGAIPPLGAAADGGRPRRRGDELGRVARAHHCGTDDASGGGRLAAATRSKWREDGGDREEEEVVLLLLEPIIVVRQPPAPRATASPACLLYPT